MSHQHPLSPRFPSLLLSFPSYWITAPSAMHPYSPPPASSLPHIPCLLQPPHPHPHPTPAPPLLQLLHKLPVIDPGHIALVFPLVCLWEPQHPRPTLNEATTKAHWWEAQCERGWPQPRAPRTVHQLPQALPPHKDAHCGQRPEKAPRTRRGERNVKRG